MHDPSKMVCIRTDDKQNDWNAFDVEKWLSKPISLLATLAERGGCMMESERSTVNIYVPKEAAKEVVNILNHSDIQWDNSITDKQRDLRMHRMDVTPYRIL
jgi:hypothetical protein